MGDEHVLIGKSLPLIDGKDKVTGRMKYAGDLPSPIRTHTAKVLRSPYAHALITKLDYSEALALPGVSAVVTHEDGGKAVVGGPGCGPIMEDPSFNFRGPVLSNEVCFVGDEVAAVSAVDEETAKAALELIEVEYEELPAIFDMEEAAKEGSPPVRPWGPNTLPPTVFNWGDIDKGFEEADIIVENRTTMSDQQHAPLDRNACIAEWNGEDLTVWTSSQSLYWLRQGICAFYDMPTNRVRCYSTPTGGSFGLWWNNNFMFISIMLAKKAKRPVRIILTRDEVTTTVKRRERPITDIKLGMKKDGTLVAQSHRHMLDNGAYGNKWDPYQSVADMYTTEHGRSEFIGVATNLVTAGCMRGVGDLTLAYGIDQTIDMAAEKIEMDPVEFRRKSVWKTGARCYTSQEVLFARMMFNKDPVIRLTSNGMDDCITKGAEMIGWKEKWKGWGQPSAIDGTKRRGVGLGISTHISGLAFLGYNGVIIKISNDGAITLSTGIGRMGQAGETTQAMVAAEILGVGLDDINVIDGDTETVPTTMVTYGSNGMHMVARATRAAAEDARRQVLDIAAKNLEANAEDLDIKDGRIFVKGSPDVGIDMKKLMATPIYEYLASPEIVGSVAQGTDFDKSGKMMIANYAEVEIDTRTCQMKVLRFVAVHDSGTIVNPAVCENQVTGGMTQGLGMVLSEHLVFDEESGAILNPNFMDYKLLGPMDVPDPEIHFVDVHDEDGPFGAKGIGEGVTCAVPAAVANAVYNAIGVRLNPPINPDSIMQALKSKGLLYYQ